MALEIPEEIKDPLDNSRYMIFWKGLRRAIANTYYNAGYRKIDENCAVITKAELKEYKRQAVKAFADELKAKACRGCIDELIEKLLKEYE